MTAHHHAHHTPHTKHHDHGHHHPDQPGSRQGHDHVGHQHGAHASQRALLLALVLTFGFAGVEAVSGWFAGSLALMSDAGHMVTDSLSLVLAVLAAWIAKRPPTERMSWGYARVEVLAALFNAGFMVAVVMLIAWSAVGRLLAPQQVDGATVMWVAAIGLGINLLVAWILSRGDKEHRDMNTRGALLHVMGDALGSVAALVSGLVIRQTGWTPIDPLLSVGICALILVSTLRLAREAIHTLLQGVPGHLSVQQVGQRMARARGVIEVHDLHIWSMDSRQAALAAHVTVTDMADWPRVLNELRTLLHDDFAIEHITLQAEETPTLATIAVQDIVRPSRAR